MEQAAPALARLDHVTLVGRHEDVEGLGFEVTPTGRETRHARVFFERAYLEVITPDEDAPAFGTRGWFLRPDDLQVAADRLRDAGIAASEPSPYLGVDGTWLDVEVGKPGETAIPLLTRRMDLPRPSGRRRRRTTRTE
jgi:hypothetical protein